MNSKNYVSDTRSLVVLNRSIINTLVFHFLYKQ